VTQSVTLDATTDESGVEMKEFTFGGVSWADFTTLDLKLTLSYSGTAFSSAQPPAIHAVYIPMKMQEPLSR
jgi:hypothetical protein